MGSGGNTTEHNSSSGVPAAGCSADAGANQQTVLCLTILSWATEITTTLKGQFVIALRFKGNVQLARAHINRFQASSVTYRSSTLSRVASKIRFSFGSFKFLFVVLNSLRRTLRSETLRILYSSDPSVFQHKDKERTGNKSEREEERENKGQHRQTVKLKISWWNTLILCHFQLLLCVQNPCKGSSVIAFGFCVLFLSPTPHPQIKCHQNVSYFNRIEL